MKRAENADALALRVYEFDGVQATTTVQLPDGISRCFIANLMEVVEEEIAVAEGCVTLTFTPFEIKTLLLIRS